MKLKQNAILWLSKIGNRCEVVYEVEMGNMNDAVFHEILPGDLHLYFSFGTPNVIRSTWIA